MQNNSRKKTSIDKTAATAAAFDERRCRDDNTAQTAKPPEAATAAPSVTAINAMLLHAV